MKRATITDVELASLSPARREGGAPNASPQVGSPVDASNSTSCEAERRALTLLQLALQGDADVAAGRVISRTDYKKRVAALVKLRR